MRATGSVSVILAAALFAAPALQRAACAETGKTAVPSTRIYFDTGLDTTDPAGTYAKLWQRQSGGGHLSYEETMDMAMSLFVRQQWERAAGVYQSAAANADNPARKAAAICGAAQSLAAAQNWQEAGQLANQVNQLIPKSKEAAALRYAYWSKAGDALESRIAEDRMKQLNLSMDGKVVFEPLTTTIIVVAITTIIVSWVVVVKPNAEDMMKIASVAFNVILAIALAP